MRSVNGVDVYSEVSEILDPSHCALLVVDMQNDGCGVDGWWQAHGRDASNIRETIPRIRVLVDAAHACGIPVALIEQTTLSGNRSDPPAWLYFKTRDGRRDTDYNLDGTQGQQTVEDIGGRADDLRIRKHRPSAFLNTNLELVLRSQGVESVLVCGNTTQGCVLATTLDASFHDFYTVVAADCVQSYDSEQHRNALAFLSSRYDFVTSDEVAALWAPTTTLEAA